MTPRKQSKRMWGLFDNFGRLEAVCRTRDEALNHNWYAARVSRVRPLTVTWSSPNPKRKAKRT